MTEGWEKLFNRLSSCMVIQILGLLSAALHTLMSEWSKSQALQAVCDLRMLFQRLQEIPGKSEGGCITASLQSGCLENKDQASLEWRDPDLIIAATDEKALPGILGVVVGDLGISKRKIHPVAL